MDETLEKYRVMSMLSKLYRRVADDEIEITGFTTTFPGIDEISLIGIPSKDENVTIINWRYLDNKCEG